MAHTANLAIIRDTVIQRGRRRMLHTLAHNLVVAVVGGDIDTPGALV
jgi:hypothetical protein